MTTEAFGRPDLARAYGTAVTITDLHTTDCPGCAAGSCGRADDLMEAEYRRIAAWREADPTGARDFDRATWPTEG